MHFVLLIETKNEVEESSIEVEPINVVLNNSAFLTKAGVVSHKLEDCYIIDAGKNTKWVIILILTSRAIEENSILFKQSMEPIGRIMEVFGQVEHPFYVLRWPKTMSNPDLAVNDIVFMNMTDAHYILPAQLNTVGTDASNVFDEEPDEKERVFIECTEDVVNGELRMIWELWLFVEDDADGTQQGINYQQDFVIPSSNKQANLVNPVVYPPMQTPLNPFYASMFSPSAPVQPQTQNDTSGLDILRNSYF